MKLLASLFSEGVTWSWRRVRADKGGGSISQQKVEKRDEEVRLSEV